MHAKNVQREPRDLSKVKCFKFQKFDHVSNKCPNRANIGEMHAKVGTEETSNDNMDRLMLTIEIDTNDDCLFEGFAVVTNR